MNSIKRQCSLITAAIILVATGPSALSQAPVIVSLSQNGELVCTNLEPGTVASVEWASSLDGPWMSTWTDLETVTASPDGTVTVSVPMFYRVRGVPRGPEPQAVECGAVVTSSLRLANDLECSGPAALVVGADDVTIDLNGHTLRSLNGAGVGVDVTGGYSGVTIQNGILEGFREAILAEGASQLSLRNLTIPSVSGQGTAAGFGYVAVVHIKGGRMVRIADSSISGVPTFVGDNPGPDAIYLESTQDVVVTNVAVDGGYSGVAFSSCGDVGNCPPVDQQLPSTGVVTNCTFANNNGGVVLINAADVTIQGSVIRGADQGIRIGFVDLVPLGKISILDNELLNNRAAIYSLLEPVGGSWPPGSLDSCNIERNWVHENTQGISLANGQGCVVSENHVENNTRFGIGLFTVSSGNMVSNNIVTGSTQSFGIGLAWSLDNEPIAGPRGNTISGNTVTGNSPVDLFHGELSSPNVWEDNTYETHSGSDIP